MSRTPKPKTEINALLIFYGYSTERGFLEAHREKLEGYEMATRWNNSFIAKRTGEGLVRVPSLELKEMILRQVKRSGFRSIEEINETQSYMMKNKQAAKVSAVWDYDLPVIITEGGADG